MTARAAVGGVGLAVLLVLLSLIRPVNHDESQYVSAAALVAEGLLPYRDFAYLQTPLQPFLFAPIAWIADAWTWPALRAANALLGIAAVVFVHRAAIVAGADARAALLAAGLFAATDAFLFGAGVVRNDALPLALFDAALIPILHADAGRATARTALLAGLLLAAAAAAKVSYAIPAIAYGAYCLVRPRHRPALVLLGALAPALFVLWTYLLAPEAFVFGVLDFPARAPAEFYTDRPWKLSLIGKVVDTVKFLALGATLPLALLVARRANVGPPGALVILLVGGAVAALLPFPTWRQYLIPPLASLFVLAAIHLSRRPLSRGWTIAITAFTAAGLINSAIEIGNGMPLPTAMRQSAGLGRALDRAKVTGRVATLSPQFLPAARRPIAPDFAAGPFYFRSITLLDDAAERRLHLVSKARPRLEGIAAIVIGAEARAVSGNDAVDAALLAIARDAGWREHPVLGTRFRLFTPPDYHRAVSPSPALRNTP